MYVGRINPLLNYKNFLASIFIYLTMFSFVFGSFALVSINTIFAKPLLIEFILTLITLLLFIIFSIIFTNKNTFLNIFKLAMIINILIVIFLSIYVSSLELDTSNVFTGLGYMQSELTKLLDLFKNIIYLLNLIYIIGNIVYFINVYSIKTVLNKKSDITK